MEDNEIIELYWQRNETAISATDKKYGKYCRTISYNILHNSEDASECVNDTYLNVWKSIPPKRPEKLSAYLGKIVRNLSLNRFRRYAAEKRGFGQTELVLSELEDCIPSAHGVEQEYDDALLVEAINRFLREQPEQKRNIFIHRYWYMHPIKQISRSFGMSESKTASLLFRMRKELRENLEKEGMAI